MSITRARCITSASSCYSHRPLNMSHCREIVQSTCIRKPRNLPRYFFAPSIAQIEPKQREPSHLRVPYQLQSPYGRSQKLGTVRCFPASLLPLHRVGSLPMLEEHGCCLLSQWEAVLEALFPKGGYDRGFQADKLWLQSSASHLKSFFLSTQSLSL